MSPVLSPSLRHPGTWAVGLLLGATVLAGCSSSPHKNVTLPSSTATSSHTSTSGSTGSSSQTSSPTSNSGGTKGTLNPGSVITNLPPTTQPVAGAAFGPICTKSQLSLSQTSSTPKGGDLIAGYTVLNTSKSRCSLVGYPTLLIIGRLGPLPSHVTDGGVAGQKAFPANQVTLAPKIGQATFLMSWSPTPSAAAPSCADGLEVDVTLPDVTGGITASSIVTACGGVVNVSPMLPNVVAGS